MAVREAVSARRQQVPSLHPAARRPPPASFPSGPSVTCCGSSSMLLAVRSQTSSGASFSSPVSRFWLKMEKNHIVVSWKLRRLTVMAAMSRSSCWVEVAQQPRST